MGERVLNWGILSTSNFAHEFMVPALQQCKGLKVLAVGSRDAAKAKVFATEHDVPRVHESYEALLADPDIDVIYNPLPNHMHVDWSIKAARAGKHVLCEKPLALHAGDVEKLIATQQETGVFIEEAFVVRHHPQWLRVRALVQSGRIGGLHAAQGCFFYNMIDPENYRSKPEMGGGGLFDIGVYPVVTARFVFGEEPVRVSAAIDRHPDHGVDRLVSATLEFPSGMASIACGTQIAVHQKMTFFGSKGRIEVPDPFAQNPKREARIIIGGEGDIWEPADDTVETFPRVNQYVAQAERFCASITGEQPQAYPLDDALRFSRILDALFRAGETGRFETVEP